MNAPIFVLIELALAGLLSACVTRFNLQLVGANLPVKDETELEITVRQTTGFALIAGALSVQASDNLFFCGFHSIQTALLVSGIMAVVLFWKSVPTVCAKACDYVDEKTETFVTRAQETVSRLTAPRPRPQVSAAPSEMVNTDGEKAEQRFSFESVKQYVSGCYKYLVKQWSARSKKDVSTFSQPSQPSSSLLTELNTKEPTTDAATTETQPLVTAVLNPTTADSVSSDPDSQSLSISAPLNLLPPVESAELSARDGAGAGGGLKS